MGYYASGDSFYAAGDPGFFDWLGGAAKAVGGAIVGGLKTVAPIAGAIVGSIVPGVGTGLGAALGGGISAGLGALGVGSDGGGGEADLGTSTAGPGWFGGRFAARQQPIYQDMTTYAAPPSSMLQPWSPRQNYPSFGTPRGFAQPMLTAMPMSASGFQEDFGGVDWEEED